MIKLYIPNRRWLFNTQYDLVDQEGRIVYRHRSNLFRTKRHLENSNNEILIQSKTLFELTEKHVITRNEEIMTYVTAKSIFSNEIIVSQLWYSVKVNKLMKFSIFNHQKEVLTIGESDRKDCSHLILVEEDQIEFLIMLMFTIIVLLDIRSSY